MRRRMKRAGNYGKSICRVYDNYLENHRDDAATPAKYKEDETARETRDKTEKGTTRRESR